MHTDFRKFDSEPESTTDAVLSRDGPRQGGAARHGIKTLPASICHGRAPRHQTEFPAVFQRPRVRSVESVELSIPTYEWAAATDPLDRATLHAIAAGVTTRRYRSTVEELPEGEASLSVSKSAVSRRFVTLSTEQLHEWLSRPLDALQLPVIMVDGICFGDRVILVALGIDAKRKKHILGLREGSTEKTQVVKSLLSDLVERGLDADLPRLWVIDGGKALRSAIVKMFGVTALIQRCQEHKRRNVLEHLPKRCTPMRWPPSTTLLWVLPPR